MQLVRYNMQEYGLSYEAAGAAAMQTLWQNALYEGYAGAFAGGVSAVIATPFGLRRALKNTVDTMSNSSDISPQKQDLLKAMDDNMNENSIDIDVSAGEGANANIRTEWDAAAALQHEGDTSLQSTTDTETMQTAEGYNAQIDQAVTNSIQNNVKANPEGVQTALTEGMGVLLYLEVRLQSDSGNINYAGFKADATSNAYVDFITKRGSMEAVALVMAGDIRTVMQTQTLTVSEKAQLMGVLAGLTGSVELAEAYVGQMAAGTEASIVSAGDGNAANMDEGIQSGYNRSKSAGETLQYFKDEQLKTEPNKAYFWSGLGEEGAEIAASIAKKNGGVTLETTIEGQGIKMPKFDINNPNTVEAWYRASAAYAKQASGEVRAIVSSNLRPTSIWNTVELPALKANPNVTKIIVIDPVTLVDTIIFLR